MAYSSFDLELLNLQQLKDLAGYHGIKPVGNPGYRQSWIIALMSFDKMAIRQMERGQGIKAPPSKAIDSLIDLIAYMGEPTGEQKALMQRTLATGIKMDDMDGYRQNALIKMIEAQQKIKEALALLVNI